jgi:hypothetical protein
MSSLLSQSIFYAVILRSNSHTYLKLCCRHYPVSCLVLYRNKKPYEPPINDHQRPSKKIRHVCRTRVRTAAAIAPVLDVSIYST